MKVTVRPSFTYCNSASKGLKRGTLAPQGSIFPQKTTLGKNMQHRREESSHCKKPQTKKSPIFLWKGEYKGEEEEVVLPLDGEVSANFLESASAISVPLIRRPSNKGSLD